MSIYDGIVEVRQCGMNIANRLLAEGYRLLAVEQVAQGIERERKEGGAHNEATFYIGKRLEYVIGRTAEQRPLIDVLTEWNAKAKAAREAAEAQP